ncbi:hypothetical protein SEA_PUPPER_165 [Gordonia phage Pupper]|uniref:RCK C-terminal domain-containing protein n=1 Tax=Gordonia phage Pupper TaxID=2571249 RepID=A0A4Y6EML6_9CAUD|nr:hypothetical protein KHQ83_gp112 [Gordonia phage Pupper]QDF18651.1 hypothetical protein SEA_PUPPER_165 [Gordonia phage Pupper]QDF18883.1 hypothetical protein SEA_SCENTAE_164 [Gordonia phage SCentae]
MAEQVPSSTTPAMGRKETSYDVSGVTSCLLCGKAFGESDPRRGYVSAAGGVLIGHSKCVDIHEFGGSAVAPIQADIKPTAAFTGKRIQFLTFADLQDFIVKRGPIPESAQVSIGDTILQVGDL